MAFPFSNMLIGVGLSSKSVSRNHLQLQPSVRVLPIVRGKHHHCTHASHLDHLSLSSTMSGDLKSKFMQVYDSLKSDIFRDPSFEFDDHSRQWVERVIDYSVPGGKFNRAITLVETYKLLKGGELTNDELKLTCVLGWCTEWLQACVLVLDDVIDESHMRRGQPCWFRQPQVGMIAVNDALILRNHIAIILKKYFKRKNYYVDLLELFNKIEYQGFSGQMIDMITTNGEKDLSKFSVSTNLRILQYKTAYGSFYIPVACALLMMGEKLNNHFQVKDILIKMGIYFSVQDDYLDTFGDPKVIGKTGKDIENFKCSWLVAKALELASEEQKKILNENYGKKDIAMVAKVEELYNALNLQGVYEDYEKTTYKELIESIEALPSKAMKQVLKSFLGRIYKRQK